MKICSSICEYNPFHLGHKKHLNYINEVLKPDYTVVIMSGNFTERGEPAILDKYTRASHAIKGGADIVIELPAIFSTANAEIFAKGGLKLINALPKPTQICFGVETDNPSELIETAKFLANENEDYKYYLKKHLDSGVSFAKAKYLALVDSNQKGVNPEFLSSPNNILGVEYVKAILQKNYDVQIKPILRQSDYNSCKLDKNLPSALAIRTAISEGKTKKTKNYLPHYVYEDLPKKLPNLDREILYSLLIKSKEDLIKISDLTEGLENKIKALIKDNYTLPSLIEKLKTKRYTQTRLNRIMISSLLNVEKDFIFKCLNESLYFKVLAINGNKKNVLSDLSKESKYPLITRKSDFNQLSGVAKECFLKDVEANDIYNLATNTKTNEYEMKTIIP